MTEWDWIGELARLRRESRPAVLCTVSEAKGSTPRGVGAKMLVLAGGAIRGSIGGGHLEALVIADALASLESGLSGKFRYPLGAKAGQCCGGLVEVLLECLNRNPHLYLFGAGHVASAICRTLVATPFTIHLIDDREEWVQSPDIPSEVIRHPCEWDDFVGEAEWDAARTYIGIMTYRHDTDEAIVADVVERKAKYIGLIGSEAKWKRFRERLMARGVSEEKLLRVKSPIGLPLGGKAPQEIAISFAAELLQFHYA